MNKAKLGKDPINHHYVPRFLLANFTNADEKLWVYDSDAKRVFPSSPLKTGFESHLYTMSGNRGGIEKEMARLFDNPGAKVIDLLLARKDLGSEEMAQFLGFVAAQMQRTPLRLELLASQIAPTLQESFERIRRHDEEFRSRVRERLLEGGTPPEKVDDVFLEATKFTVRPTKDFLLQSALRMIPNIQKELCGMCWNFLQLRDGDPDLLIGDHPVMLFDATKLENGSSVPLGIRNDRIELVMPLSRRMVAMAHWNGTPGFFVAGEGVADSTNELTMRYARRFVFGASNSDELLRQVIDLRGTGPKVTTNRIEQGTSTYIVSQYS